MSNIISVPQKNCICDKCRTIANMPFGFASCTCGGSYHPIEDFDYFDVTNRKLNKIIEYLELPWYRRLLPLRRERNG